MTASSISTKLKGIQWLHYFYSLLCSASYTARLCFGTGLVLGLIETWAVNLLTWNEDSRANAVFQLLFCLVAINGEGWPARGCYVKWMMTSVRTVTPSQNRQLRRLRLVPTLCLWYILSSGFYVVKLVKTHIFVNFAKWQTDNVMFWTSD